MSTLNGKTVKQVSFSPVQKVGATAESKAVIVVFEDDTQQVINGGITSLTNQATSLQNQIAQAGTRMQELNDLKALVQALPA